MSLRKEFVDWKKNIWVKSLLEEEGLRREIFDSEEKHEGWKRNI
jgi:hypothetical protein